MSTSSRPSRREARLALHHDGKPCVQIEALPFRAAAGREDALGAHDAMAQGSAIDRDECLRLLEYLGATMRSFGTSSPFRVSVPGIFHDSSRD